MARRDIINNGILLNNPSVQGSHHLIDSYGGFGEWQSAPS